MPGESVVTFAPDGSRPYYLGRLGHVAGLNYSDSLPGGPDQMNCTFQYPPWLRHEAVYPGRRVLVYKGAQTAWEGSLLEPVSASDGWAITADGIGNMGARFRAIYTTWTTDDVVNQAIARGLRWIKGTVSGGFMTDVHDNAADSVTDHLNLVTRPQSQTWQVHRVQGGWQVDLIALPSTATPTRLLVTTSPAVRTLAGYFNALYARYEATVDANGNPVTFGLGSATNAASIAAHDRLEDYWDLTSSGLMTGGTANSLAAGALAKYQATSYSAGFQVRRGQYLTTGGAAVDLGLENAGEVVRLIVADGPYGGEVSTGPIQFVVGQTSYDSDNDLLTVTPYQSWRGDLGNVMQLLQPKAPA